MVLVVWINPCIIIVALKNEINAVLGHFFCTVKAESGW